ncbi:MAG: transcription-repair coupling factor [Acidobacteria bacterium]|nr:transcription-repair coupling factor [Acidobacteriota bacterium]
MIRETFLNVASQEEFDQLVRRVSGESGRVRLSGLYESAKALYAALIAVRLERPLVYVAQNNQLAEYRQRDLQYFLSLLAPESGEAALFPSVEFNPYSGLSPHPEISRQRALTLWKLGQGKVRVLVLPLRSFLYRMPPPMEFYPHFVRLAKGSECAPEELEKHLEAWGYVAREPVTEVGEFSRRGGILDLFSPQTDAPCRLEFFGDQLESLRTYDVDTQRSTGEPEACEIVPMREVSGSAERMREWAEAARKRWAASRYFRALSERLGAALHGECFQGFEFLLPLVRPYSDSILDYLPPCVFFVDEPELLQSQAHDFSLELHDRFVHKDEEGQMVLPPVELLHPPDLLDHTWSSCTTVEARELGVVEGLGAEGEHVFNSQPVRKFHGRIQEFVSEVRRSLQEGHTCFLLMGNVGKAERVVEILEEYEVPAQMVSRASESPSLPAEGRAYAFPHDLSTGFCLPGARLKIFASSEIFDEQEVQLVLPRRPRKAGAFVSDFRDLKEGDYVVHVDHGIGEFRGLVRLGRDGEASEFVVLLYQDDAKLYVPVERLDLIQKYTGSGDAKPERDRLGGTAWLRRKARIRKSMRDMAEELLKLQARRSLTPGYAFPPDDNWQQELENAFEFEETPDQEAAIQEMKRDMEQPRTMDRLVCGDVGYGKTEVAMRGAFKAVLSGKQVAVLAPTTVLSFQHYNTFQRRFAPFPVTIELLSRFRSRAEQKKVLEELEAGRVDILIGTHRLLSRDVAFHDLGLLIVDEEQQFGVAHKERLKALKASVDVLTMTATPLPRTLHMSLMGLRDLSVIETPPRDRLAIQTAVVKYDPDVIRSAIRLELARGGQVYFVHNRVESIYTLASLVQRLCPEARLAVAHGQMEERDLERVMINFINHQYDVLVSTTIIENGLDIPLVNTILIHRADRLGLAQLYQLRGRVGRSNRRAYAYLLVPPEEILSSTARRRLATIREFSDLGSGFRIAALDLEIRGAGNLLGPEQHGHINAVGFELYCQLLERSVRELKGEETAEEIQTSIHLGLNIRIPETYVPDMNQRLRIYKKISSARDEQELENLRAEMVDRYGTLPESVGHLFEYGRLKLLAQSLQVVSIDRNTDKITIKFHERPPIQPDRLVELVAQRRLRLSPSGVLTLPLRDAQPQSIFQDVRSLLSRLR